MPVPDSATLCGLLVALSVIVIAPVRVPSWVGVKVTLTLHFFAGANVLPQVFELTAKSPLGTMLVMLSVPRPLFEIVKDFAAEVLLTTVLANVNDVVDRETTGLGGGCVTVSWKLV